MLDLDHVSRIYPQVINNLLRSEASYAQLTKPENILTLLELSVIEFGPLIPDLYIYSALARQ